MGVLYIGRTKVNEFVFANKYKVTLTGEHCTFIGNGYHNYSQMVTIEAIPEQGYNFYSWSDGNTENPRQIRIDGDIELQAKVDLYYIHYTATADISDTMPTNWGDAILVNDSCTYNADTQEGSLAFLNVPTEIPKTTFYYNKYIISITPNYIVSIGDQAFSGCSGLTSVTIPNSVTSIGSSAFSGCSGLTSVTIPNSVTSIGVNAFAECSGLTSVNIPNSVTSIGESAFYGCSGLTSVTIPNSVTSIKQNMFNGCSSLISVTIPNFAAFIDRYAFYNCKGLVSVIIGNSIRVIYNSAFYNCISLTSIIYEGTIKQWNAITKINGWYSNIQTTEVHCTDGDVSLI